MNREAYLDSCERRAATEADSKWTPIHNGSDLKRRSSHTHVRTVLPIESRPPRRDVVMSSSSLEKQAQLTCSAVGVTMGGFIGAKASGGM